MTYLHNSYYPIHVITTKGVKEISHIQPGDEVYDYRTGKPFIVRNTQMEKINKVFEVMFSDGRTEIYGWTQPIYLRYGITIRPCDIIDTTMDPFYLTKMTDVKMPSVSIMPHAIEYNAEVQKHPYPDPCIAGALLTFGYYDDEYVNLPSYSERINNLFSHKYNVDYALKLGKNGRVYFTFKGGDGSCITWNEMFPKYNLYAVSKHFASPSIPYEYTHATITDRWKYIRGVFDVGYDSELFPDMIVCLNESEDRLKCLQQMLWSLGVLSKIEYYPSGKQRMYKLEIIGDYAGKPNFFYDCDNLRHTLVMDNLLLKQRAPESLRMKSMTYIEDGVVPNIVGMDGAHVYFTDKFLPRMSI